MTLEDAAVRAMVPVVGALCFLFKLLWNRSDECENDRRELRKAIEGLLKDGATVQGELGEAEAMVQLMQKCPQPQCPWKGMATFVIGGAILMLLLPSCASGPPTKVTYHRSAKEFVSVEIPQPQPSVFSFIGSIFGAASSMITL